MKTDMTKGNPMKIILLFSIPVLMGNLFQQFYNMGDTIIVGQYLGSKALAAVGSTGCIMFLVLGFANGIAQGFGVMASHAFGAKNEKLLKHYVALSIILTVIVSVVLTIPTVLASRQLLIWLNTPDDILVMADAYIKVIFAGIFCTMSYNVASGLLRSIGDSKTPLYFLIFSSVLNIVLDIFFIVVVKAGTAGLHGLERNLANALNRSADGTQLFNHCYRNDDFPGCGQCVRFAGGSCVYRRIQGQQYRDTDHAYTWNSRCDLLRTKSRSRKIRQDI